MASDSPHLSLSAANEESGQRETPACHDGSVNAALYGVNYTTTYQKAQDRRLSELEGPMVALVVADNEEEKSETI